MPLIYLCSQVYDSHRSVWPSCKVVKSTIRMNTHKYRQKSQNSVSHTPVNFSRVASGLNDSNTMRTLGFTIVVIQNTHEAPNTFMQKSIQTIFAVAYATSTDHSLVLFFVFSNYTPSMHVGWCAAATFVCKFISKNYTLTGDSSANRHLHHSSLLLGECSVCCASTAEVNSSAALAFLHRFSTFHFRPFFRAKVLINFKTFFCFFSLSRISSRPYKRFRMVSPTQ